jgi:hypothetical protein
MVAYQESVQNGANKIKHNLVSNVSPTTDERHRCQNHEIIEAKMSKWQLKARHGSSNQACWKQ